MMVMSGTDAHKRSHTIPSVAVDPAGIEIGSVAVPATTDGHFRAVQWAAKYTQRQWAIDDCWASSRRLEGDLLGVGERVVRVQPISSHLVWEPSWSHSLWTRVDVCGIETLSFRAVWTGVDAAWRSTVQMVGGSSPSGRASPSPLQRNLGRSG